MVLSMLVGVQKQISFAVGLKGDCIWMIRQRPLPAWLRKAGVTDDNIRIQNLHPTT